jgi:hypothetical protein
MKPKVVWIGSTPITPISAKEHRKIAKQIRKHHARLRERYPVVHGKVVDFITHSVNDGTLYVSVRFKERRTFPCATPAGCSSSERTSAT